MNITGKKSSKPILHLPYVMRSPTRRAELHVDLCSLLISNYFQQSCLARNRKTLNPSSQSFRAHEREKNIFRETGFNKHSSDGLGMQHTTANAFYVDYLAQHNVFNGSSSSLSGLFLCVCVSDLAPGLGSLMSP